MENFSSVFVGLVCLASLLSSGSAQALDAQKGIVTLNMAEEPRTLDPQKAQDTEAFYVLSHVMEGLTRLDPKNQSIPGQASSWEQVNPTTYRFQLRKEARWHDGKQVEAEDFVYAWRRAVDPKTASLYAFILFPVKNAEKINKGQAKVEQLGVKALAKDQIEVELEQPTAYFLKLTSFATFFPSRRDLVEKHREKYASAPEFLSYNGPWLLSHWKNNASMRLSKSETYWNADQIHINQIDMPYLIRDVNSEFNMFKDGKFDLMRTLSKELLPDAQAHKLKISKYNAGTVWFLQFNVTRPVTGNKWIRRALNVALDRNEFANQVTGVPGTKPAYGIIPDYLPALNKSYGQEYPLSFKDADIVMAKDYLNKGLAELGLKKLPKLNILINDSVEHKRDVEYLQSYYKKSLGIDIGIDVQTFKVRLQKTTQKDFDIVKSGWGPDYMDPMTFADLYTSWNTNNDSGWAHAGYDELIRKAMVSTDPKERLEMMHQANQILVDEVPIVPMIQASRVYVQNPQLVGVLRRPLAPDPDFYYARIQSLKKEAKKP